MVVLGLVLVLIALALGVALLVGTSAPEVAGQTVQVEVIDAVTFNLSPLALVIAGMLAMFLLGAGLALIKTTLTRRARDRRLRKQEEAETRERLVRRDSEEPPLAEERTTRMRGDEPGPGPRATRPGRRDDPDATRAVPRQDPDATRAVPRQDPEATQRIPKDPGPRS